MTSIQLKNVTLEITNVTVNDQAIPQAAGIVDPSKNIDSKVLNVFTTIRVNGEFFSSSPKMYPLKDEDLKVTLDKMEELAVKKVTEEFGI